MTNKIKLKLPPLKAWGLAGLITAVAVFMTAARPSPQAQKAGVCAECHETVCAEFELVRHAEVETGRWTEIAHQAETICANCHGDPSKHIEAGGGPGTIFAFKRTDAVQAKDQKCLNCHSGIRSQFFAGPHGKASLDCTYCHSDLMKAATPLKNSNAVCAACHEDIFSQFQLNERHRLQEGILNCTTCHDPHEPATQERLGGFKHQACLKCHTDKGGPFLYEHGVSRVEGCSACHEAHGTPNRHLLTHQSTSDLCFSCHAAAPSWHSRFTSESTNCTLCHSTIHGSNLSKIFLK